MQSQRAPELQYNDDERLVGLKQVYLFGAGLASGDNPREASRVSLTVSGFFTTQTQRLVAVQGCLTYHNT